MRIAGEWDFFSESCNTACRFTPTPIGETHAEALRSIRRSFGRAASFCQALSIPLRIAFQRNRPSFLSRFSKSSQASGLDQKTYYSLVDESGKLAKRNILANTPQFKDLLAEWEAGEGKEGRGK